MLSIKLNRKAEIRAKLPKLISLIRAPTDERVPELLGLLDELEGDFEAHFLGRSAPWHNPGNPDSDPLEPIHQTFEDLRYWATADAEWNARQREFMLTLNGLLQRLAPELPADPFKALEMIYTDFNDDWAEFNSTNDLGYVSVIRDDLETLRKIEPKFKRIGGDVYKQFRRILERAGALMSYLPSKPGMMSDAARGKLFERVERLNEAMSSLLAPEEFEFKEEGKGTPTTVNVRDLTEG